MTHDGGGGRTGFFGFIVGGMVVVLAVLAFAVYGGQGTGPRQTVNLELPPPAAPK